MLKNYFPLVFVSFFLTNIYSQTTAIPDANFEKALISLGIDTDDVVNGYVATDDISGVTSLDVSSKGIEDLTGLEDFWSLTTLICSHNPLESLQISEPIEVLDCSYTELTSLNLTGVESIRQVDCSHSKLTYLAIESRMYGTWNYSNYMLESLNCEENQISNLFLSNATLLENLNCGSNQIENLKLQLNTALTTLDCQNNSLEYLDVKNGNNSSFTSFNAEQNPLLTCIDVDNANDANIGLGAYGNWLKDDTATYSEDCFPKTNVPDFGFELLLIKRGFDDIMDDFVLTSSIDTITKFGVPSLVYSGPGDIIVFDITGIEDFKALEDLTITTGIIYINISKNIKLKKLEIMEGFGFYTGPGVESLDLSQNIELNYLRMDTAEQLKTLDLSNNINLSTVSIFGTKSLTELNVKNGKNSLISNFYVERTPLLACIDVDNANEANAGTGCYSTWIKDDTTFYSEDCKTALGVDDDLLNEAITLYPNPVYDILTIDSEISLTKVEIYSMLGKKVKDIISDFKTIQINNLSNGVYIVRINSENGLVTKKLIKK